MEVCFWLFILVTVICLSIFLNDITSFSEQFFCANCKNAYYKRTMRIVKWTILLSKKKGGNQNAYYKRIRTVSGAYYKR